MRRETPVRRHRQAPDAVLRHPPGLRRRPAGSASARTGADDGFQLSQRADYFEVEVGLETTLKRPIINTRDEPHADPEKYRRLHVIIGDANLSEISTYLKVGTTALVLAMIEDGLPRRLDLSVHRPVRALHAVSHDPSLQAPGPTSRDGRRLTALQLQMEYLEQARKYVEDRFGSDVDARDARRARALGVRPRPARRRPDALSRRARLGRQAGAARGLPRPRRPGLGRRPSCRRSTCSTATYGRRRGSTTGCRRAGAWSGCSTTSRGRARGDAPPEDTRAYFRGRVPAPLRGPGRGRVVGLGHLRRARPRLAAAGADPRAAARHQGARRRRCSTRSKDATALVDALTGGH